MWRAKSGHLGDKCNFYHKKERTLSFVLSLCSSYYSVFPKSGNQFSSVGHFNSSGTVSS